MDLSYFSTAALQAEIRLRFERVAKGTCPRCGRNPKNCGHLPEPRVAVPTVQAQPDGSYTYAPDATTGTFPADVPAPDASNPYATAGDFRELDDRCC